MPCGPVDLDHFRNRLGQDGATLILISSTKMFGTRAQEAEVVIDATLQEKNIKHPTDNKLASMSMQRCWKLDDNRESA